MNREDDEKERAELWSTVRKLERHTGRSQFTTAEGAMLCGITRGEFYSSVRPHIFQGEPVALYEPVKVDGKLLWPTVALVGAMQYHGPFSLLLENAAQWAKPLPRLERMRRRQGKQART